MKPTDYIEWDNLKDIPFFLCHPTSGKWTVKGNTTNV